MILLALLLLAALMAFIFRKQYGVRCYLTAFAVYVTILVGVWLCLALPVLLFLKG